MKEESFDWFENASQFNSSLNSVELHANPFYLLLQHQWELEHNFCRQKVVSLETVIKESCTGLHWILWEGH